MDPAIYCPISVEFRGVGNPIAPPDEPPPVQYGHAAGLGRPLSLSQTRFPHLLQYQMSDCAKTESPFTARPNNAKAKRRKNRLTGASFYDRNSLSSAIVEDNLIPVGRRRIDPVAGRVNILDFLIPIHRHARSRRNRCRRPRLPIRNNIDPIRGIVRELPVLRTIVLTSGKEEKHGNT